MILVKLSKKSFRTLSKVDDRSSAHVYKLKEALESYKARGGAAIC